MIRFSHEANSWQYCIPRTRIWTWKQLMNSSDTSSSWTSISPEHARFLVDEGAIII